MFDHYTLHPLMLLESPEGDGRSPVAANTFVLSFSSVMFGRPSHRSGARC